MAVENAPTAVSPDSRYATWLEPSSGAFGYKLDCWDLHSSRELRAEPLRGPLSPNAFYSLAYNAAGSRLVSAGSGSVQLWRVHDGCPTLQKGVPLPVRQVRAAGFRDAQTIVAVGSDGTLRVLDASSGRQLNAWRVRYKGFTSDPVTSAAISPDGEFAAIGLDNGGLVRVNTYTGDTRSFIAAQPELSNLAATSISAVAWSPNGQDIALSEGNGVVIVLGRDGQTVMNVPGLGAESLQFMFGGTALMGVDANGTAHAWDLGTGSILSSFPVDDFAPPHYRFALPDPRRRDLSHARRRFETAGHRPRGVPGDLRPQCSRLAQPCVPHRRSAAHASRDSAARGASATVCVELQVKPHPSSDCAAAHDPRRA
jgi:WD40 repeat protein